MESHNVAEFTVLLMLVSVYPSTTLTAQFTGKGTVHDIKTIFAGRCAEYTAGLINPNIDKDELSGKNCSRLWELFYGSFAYKQPCNVTLEIYREFVEEASITIPSNKALFWDGWDIYDVVRSYADEARRATSLEFLLIGYLINELTFCGQVAEPGLNFDVCPADGECGFGIGPADAFWAAASTHFGTQARGNIQILLNSNRPGGSFHTDNSYFTDFELSNLDPAKVTGVDIYLVTFLGESPGDTCETGTIPDLKKRLSDKGIPYKCYDQPKSVRHLLCADGVDDDQCSFGHATVLNMSKLLLLAILMGTFTSVSPIL